MEIQLDTGFQFGLGAFETIAIEEKKPIFLEVSIPTGSRALRARAPGRSSHNVPHSMPQMRSGQRQSLMVRCTRTGDCTGG